MAPFEEALLLLLLITVFSVFARWAPWPVPISFVLGGVALAFCPGFPHLELRPDLFFVVFLPPLLFADGWLMPLREFFRFRRPIAMLATGLVVFTTLGIGLVAHALLPSLPLPMCFALGAVVSPTDAVAVSAITEKLKVPTRLRIVLSGESLMNDATGLTAFRFALAAVSGSFSVGHAVSSFLILAAGGIAVGLAVAYAIGKLRDWLIRLKTTDSLVEITISLLTPYAAYLVAEHLHYFSEILAVVAAGLYSGWRDPVRMDAETRQTTWTIWNTLLFWLNSLAFLLLGLQFPGLLRAVSGSYTIPQLLAAVAAIAGTAIALRIIWFFPGAYSPFLFKSVRAAEERPPWQQVLVGSWAGMRGTVTLAAALSIPATLASGAAFPGRDLVIFLAFGVIAVTLLLQGTTTAWLIRRLGVRESAAMREEEQLARATAIRSGLAALQEIAAGQLNPEERSAIGHILAEYEARLSELESEGEAGGHVRGRRAADLRFRFAALEAERKAVDALWQEEKINDEVHRPLQALLDHEEAMLRISW
jgi:CPA1 family monovalent cation:H+ antiporter